MSLSRGQFSSKMGFILAAAGSAVGLGNIWGFPIKTAQNGGAAFLFVYLLLVAVLCLPVVIAEIAIGRSTEKNPVGAMAALAPGTRWKTVGKLGVLCGFMILSFYVVIAGWVFGYFLETVTGGLERLSTDGAFGTFAGSAWKNLAYTGLFMTATVGIVVGGVKDGIERWARYLMPTLVIMLFALIAYVLTLENAGKGVAFYLVPDFAKLTMKNITAALSQAFFSLSLGMGALITYGSYVSKTDNIISSAAIVAAFDCFIAFSAGLLIIPAIFTLAPETTSETIQAGPGLIFVFLPKVFMNLSGQVGYFFASFLASFFFLLICFAALTSTISLLEVPTAYVVDEKGVRRKRAALSVGIIIFFIAVFSLLGNGAVDFLTNFVTYPSGVTKDSLSLVADIFNDTALPLGGFLISAFVAFKWKTANFSDEISHGYPSYKGSMVEKALNTVIYVCPFIILFIFLNTLLALYFGIDVFK